MIILFPVRIVINEVDFTKTREDDETANLIWSDSAVQHEKIAELRNYQVHAMATMSSQQTLFRGTQVSRLEKKITMSDPIAALNRKKKNRTFAFIVGPIKLFSGLQQRP